MEAPWQRVGGKISKKRTQVVWAQNAYGTRYTQVLSKRSTLFSSSEIAVQDKFRQVSAKVVEVLSDATQRAQYQVAFAQQSRYKTLRGYIFAQEYAKL